MRKPVDPYTLYRTIQHAIETTPRHSIRLNTCFPVVIADDPSPDVARTEYVSALSENGLFILTYRTRPVGSVFSVRFFVYERPIDVRAIVLYTFTTAGGPLKEPAWARSLSRYPTWTASSSRPSSATS